MRNFLKLFGLSIERKEEKKENKSFVPPNIDGADVAITTMNGGYFNNTSIQFDENIKEVENQITKYRQLSLNPEADDAIDDIVNEAITSSRTEDLVKIDLSNVDNISENVKKVITEEFENVLNLLNYKNKSYDYFRDFYIDGRLYFHKIYDEENPTNGITEIRQVDALAIKKVVELRKEKDQETGTEMVFIDKEYYVYNGLHSSTSLNKNVGNKAIISPDAITFVHSGLYNHNKTMILGYLHKAIKPLNQLNMLENASVIYRITRAPERRVFNVAVGRMPHRQVEQYMKEVVNRHRNNLQYDANTGEVIDNKKHMHMLEDFFFPKYDDGRGTEIDVLPGGQNLGEMDDVIYFQKKFYRSLNVPISRLDTENTFSMGRVAEITRDEVKFSKFVDRLLKRFSELFDDVLKTNLILKKIIREDEWDNIKNNIYYDFLKDSYFQELKELEIFRERMGLLQETNDFVGKYFSREWVKRHILKQDDLEIEEMEKQIEEEKDKYKGENEDEF